MIDEGILIKNTLSTILPTYHEMTVINNVSIPCFMWMELSNVALEEGDTIGYSRIQYQIKIIGYDLEVINNHALALDAAMRGIKYKRVSSNTMIDNHTMMIQRIYTYEALGKEDF